eukprot:863970-Amphidinium_carterae.1
MENLHTGMNLPVPFVQASRLCELDFLVTRLSIHSLLHVVSVLCSSIGRRSCPISESCETISEGT